MDIAGFKAYLFRDPEKRFRVDFIPALVSLEQKLAINLDDYIPYADDYSKVMALDNKMNSLPLSEHYNEPVNFTLNDYFRYKMEIAEKKDGHKLEVDSNDVPSFFSFHGNSDALIEKLSEIMTTDDATQFTDFLLSCDSALFEDGDSREIETRIEYPNDGLLHALHGESNININIKALTLMAIALLLDIHLTVGFAATTLAIMGVNGHAIVRIDEFEGEKCIIREAILKKNHIVDGDVLPIHNRECVNNDLQCRYRRDGMCTISKDALIDILDDLSAKNVFTKIRKMYKYNF